MKEIIVKIEKGKPIEYVTEGFAGKECKEASKFIDEVLGGKIIEDKDTADMYRTETAGEKIYIRR